jgi:hypothetical protein
LFETLAEKYPRTEWVLKDKYGGYMDDDPELWADFRGDRIGINATSFG